MYSNEEMLIIQRLVLSIRENPRKSVSKALVFLLVLTDVQRLTSDVYRLNASRTLFTVWNTSVQLPKTSAEGIAKTL